MQTAPIVVLVAALSASVLMAQRPAPAPVPPTPAAGQQPVAQPGTSPAGPAAYDELIALGRTEIDGKLYADAISTSQKAITIDPARWDAYAIRGLAQEQLRDYPAAIISFSQANAFAPADRKATLQRLLEEVVAAQGGGRSSTPSVPASVASAPHVLSSSCYFSPPFRIRWGTMTIGSSVTFSQTDPHPVAGYDWSASPGQLAIGKIQFGDNKPESAAAKAAERGQLDERAVPATVVFSLSVNGKSVWYGCNGSFFVELYKYLRAVR